MNRWDRDIVDQWHTFWSTERVILIDLQGKYIKPILIYSHKLVVYPHDFLLEYLKLAIAQLVLLKLVEVIELNELPNSYHICVKLNVEACGYHNADEHEHCSTHAVVIMPHHSEVLAWVELLHLVRDVDAEEASVEQYHRKEQMTLDGLLNPDFKLLLALEVDASVEVLVGGFVYLTIHIPFHSD